MNTLAEIRAKLNKLEIEAQELKLLKQDYARARNFRRLLVNGQFD